MSNERKSGVVKSFNFIETTKKGWKKFDIVNDDGDSFRGLIPKDCNYNLSQGDHVEWFEGQFGGFIIDTQKLPGGDGGSGGSNGGGKSSGSKRSSGGSGSNARENYWEGKYDYEVAIRDPKIEFQKYFEETMRMYAAALPHLENPPTDTDGVDQYIDAAFETAKTLYRRVQAKEESPTPVNEGE